jgi:hypothetical protein
MKTTNGVNMHNVETAFLRKGKQMWGFDNEGGRILIETFGSINKAKAWSRREQKEHGGLGAGYVRRVQ